MKAWSQYIWYKILNKSSPKQIYWETIPRVPECLSLRPNWLPPPPPTSRCETRLFYGIFVESSKIRYLTQAFQDPPLYRSTHKIRGDTLRKYFVTEVPNQDLCYGFNESERTNNRVLFKWFGGMMPLFIIVFYSTSNHFIIFLQDIHPWKFA